MDLHNREGTAVDPVPFLVVVGTAFAVCYSFGPIYLLTFGVPVPTALAVSTVLFAVLTAGAYHRLVWTYRPITREEVPVAVRFRRLVLAAVGGIALMGLLALPLIAA